MGAMLVQGVLSLSGVLMLTLQLWLTFTGRLTSGSGTASGSEFSDFLFSPAGRIVMPLFYALLMVRLWVSVGWLSSLRTVLTGVDEQGFGSTVVTRGLGRLKRRSWWWALTSAGFILTSLWMVHSLSPEAYQAALKAGNANANSWWWGMLIPDVSASGAIFGALIAAYLERRSAAVQLVFVCENPATPG